MLIIGNKKTFDCKCTTLDPESTFSATTLQIAGRFAIKSPQLPLVTSRPEVGALPLLAQQKSFDWYKQSFICMKNCATIGASTVFV
jgi:hypothetical protein